ncbi:RES domain protein [Bacteriovorax sp. BAL6_X]|uniref:RES domain-containing protein n=1 Tax=Bacteriovorax sp. BAL6_X TaxID=1201290 RepID=UPI000385BF43|nr:RES domain-containing protein [Bacteriovorax sp. BAL6_X]EPZ52552.1 RES domain protein [Bacteriovorax sp. BAL6_X]
MRNVNFNALSGRSIKSVKKSIKDFEKQDLKKLTVGEVYEQIISVLKGSVYIKGSLTAKKHAVEQKTVGLYRARKNINKDLFQIEQDLWNPEVEFINQLGRCNTSDESIFYCAESFASCLLEMSAKPGERWTVASFEHTHENLLKEISFKPLGIDVNNLIKTRSAPIPGNLSVPDYKTKLTKEDFKKNSLMQKYLRRKFREKISQNYKYKTTIAITKYFLDDPKREIDAIAYPSVNSNVTSMNYAILEDAARAHMSMTEVVCIDILSIEGTTIKSNEVARGTIVSGKIEWARLNSGSLE